LNQGKEGARGVTKRGARMKINHGRPPITQKGDTRPPPKPGTRTETEKTVRRQPSFPNPYSVPS